MSEVLANAFENTLKEETTSVITDLVEVGIDSVIDDGILKDIPFLSTVISIYGIGKTIRERHHIKQLWIFINTIRQGCIETQKREKYIEKFNENKKFRDKELEYILVVLDSYLEYEKPAMLAKLYLAFLEEIITWEVFSQYATIIKSIIPTDVGWLKCDGKIRAMESKSDCMQRLVSLGMVYEYDRAFSFGLSDKGEIVDNEREYVKTEFGELFAKIVL